MVQVNSHLGAQIPALPPPKEWNPGEVRERTLTVDSHGETQYVANPDRPWNPNEPASMYGIIPEDWPLATRSEHDGEQQIKAQDRKTTASDLSSSGLTAVHDAIGVWFDNLERLNLSKNLLTALPNALGKLQKLKTLDASDNILTSVPEAIGECQALNTLCLAHNTLSSVPHAIWTLEKLSSLDLSHNNLVRVPPMGDSVTGDIPALATGPFKGLRALRTLNLARNQLVMLPEGLSHLPSLTTLDCSQNKLGNLPSLRPNAWPELRLLDLSHNALREIPKAFTTLAKVDVLDLRRNPPLLEFFQNDWPQWADEMPQSMSVRVDHDPQRATRMRDAVIKERVSSSFAIFEKGKEAAKKHEQAARASLRMYEECKEKVDTFDFESRLEGVDYSEYELPRERIAELHLPVRDRHKSEKEGAKNLALGDPY